MIEFNQKPRFYLDVLGISMVILGMPLVYQVLSVVALECHGYLLRSLFALLILINAYQANIYLFKVNNKKHVSNPFLIFLLLILNK